jgi:hypothetical protein
MQAEADLPLRRSTVQLNSRVGVWDDQRDGPRRPPVEGVRLQEIMDLFEEEMDRSGAITNISQSVGTGTTQHIELVTLTGTSGDLSYAPADVDLVVPWFEGFRLQRVASNPSPTEFSISGTTIIVHADLADAELLVLYPLSVRTVLSEVLTGSFPRSNFNLAASPYDPDLVVILFEGSRLMRVDDNPSESEFEINNKAVHTGVEVTYHGQAVAIYPI